MIWKPYVSSKLRMREELGRIFQDDGSEVRFDGIRNVFRQNGSVLSLEDEVRSDLQESEKTRSDRNDRKSDERIEIRLEVFVQVKPKFFEPFPVGIFSWTIGTPVKYEVSTTVKAVYNRNCQNCVKLLKLFKI